MSHTSQPKHDRVATRAATVVVCEEWRKQGEKIAFTSGVFDLLHIGHIRYLNAIRGATGATRLVVAVNSDASVRTLKGADRPIVSAAERAEIIGALACVDAVFIFDEQNNAENIQALKPDFYVKAADYSIEKLSSATYLKAWGGKAVTVPMEAGHSTTGLIENIVERAFDRGALPVRMEGYPHFDRAGVALPTRAAVFLDRDGVIVEDCEYLHRLEDLRLIPGVGEALSLLLAQGYVLIVITNQPGIGLGYFSKEDFFRVNKAMLGKLSREGVKLSGIYYCPHTEAVGCDCRKPNGGLVRRACADHHLSLKGSFFIGDQTSDLETARRLGLPAILVQTGKGGGDGKYSREGDYEAENILSAAKWIVDVKASAESSSSS